MIEDDCTIIPEFIKHLEMFLENPEISKWDMLFLCMSDDNTKYLLKDTREPGKMIPSKEAYCINSSTAEMILPFLNKIHFSYRVHLSYLIHKINRYFQCIHVYVYQ